MNKTRTRSSTKKKATKEPQKNKEKPDRPRYKCLNLKVKLEKEKENFKMYSVAQISEEILISVSPDDAMDIYFYNPENLENMATSRKMSAYFPPALFREIEPRLKSSHVFFTMQTKLFIPIIKKEKGLTKEIMIELLQKVLKKSKNVRFTYVWNGYTLGDRRFFNPGKLLKGKEYKNADDKNVFFYVAKISPSNRALEYPVRDKIKGQKKKKYVYYGDITCNKAHFEFEEWERPEAQAEDDDYDDDDESNYQQPGPSTSTSRATRSSDKMDAEVTDKQEVLTKPGPSTSTTSTSDKMDAEVTGKEEVLTEPGPSTSTISTSDKMDAEVTDKEEVLTKPGPSTSTTSTSDKMDTEVTDKEEVLTTSMSDKMDTEVTDKEEKLTTSAAKLTLEVKPQASKSGFLQIPESEAENLQIAEDKEKSPRKRARKQTQPEKLNPRRRAVATLSFEEEEPTIAIKEEDRLAGEKVRKSPKDDKQPSTSFMDQTSAPGLSTSPLKKVFAETKIQIHLTNGETLVQTFSCKERLSAVRSYVELNRTDEKGPFHMMASFPKKKFTKENYDVSLEDLGLVPSAVIIVFKTN